MSGFERNQMQAHHDVLMEVSHRLGKAVRKADTIARLGGDEFAILAPEVSRQEDALIAADRIRAQIEGTPFGLAQGPLEVRASVGFALTNDPGISPEGLIEQADRAMYREKGGKGRRGGRERAGRGPT